MTVAASPADAPGIRGNGLGKGQTLLNAIAALQTTVNNSPAHTPQLYSAQAQLNLLQIEAVDYFMGSYWVSADSILVTMGNLLTQQACGKYFLYVTQQRALIAARLTQINQINPPQFSQALVYGNEAPQYSAYMPPYPNTPPDTVWYQLQTQLVDFCMTIGIIPAFLILSTMTGAQTYPFTYNTNNQYFSPYSEGDPSGDL